MGWCEGCGEWIRETYYLECVGVELCLPCYEREECDEELHRDYTNGAKIVRERCV